VRQSGAFYTAISEIVDLVEWRKNANAPASHWWWYIDVIAFVQPRNIDAEITVV
jgi:hypothetical protein